MTLVWTLNAEDKANIRGKYLDMRRKTRQFRKKKNATNQVMEMNVRDTFGNGIVELDWSMRRSMKKNDQDRKDKLWSTLRMTLNDGSFQNILI